MRLALLVCMTFMASLTTAASAQSFGGFGDSPFERDFGDVKFLDSYFGTFESKAEASPGDRNVPFTIVLANVGAHDITGIRGELSLPYGFSPAEDSGFVARSDSNTNSQAGEIFHLTFFLNVDQSVVIQQYPAAAKVEYSRLRESGLRNAHFDFYFRVPGSSVLNMKALDPFLVSLQANTVTIELSNNGTAPLSSVDVTALDIGMLSSENNMANNRNVVVYESSWDVGNIEPHSVSYMDVTVYIPETFRGEILRLPLEVRYFNAHGEEVVQNKVVDFYVRGLVDTHIYGIEAIRIANNIMVIGEIINEGNEDARFGFVYLDPLGDSNILPTSQFIDEIETDAPVPFNLPLEFDGLPVYGEHDVEITLRYKDDVREEHFQTAQATITVEELPPQPQSSIPGLEGLVETTDPSGQSTTMIAMIAAILLAIIAIVIVVRRRR